MKKRALALFLCCILLALAVGCAKKEISEDPASAGAPAEEPAAEQAESYQWDDIRFEVKEVTEDLGDWGRQLVSPEGKYIMVVLQITDGKIECGRLEQIVMDQKCVLLQDREPATVVAQGIAIEDDKAVAIGTVNVFFDVPADFRAAAADVTILPAAEAAASGNAEAIALEEGASFEWQGRSVTVVKTDTGGFSNGMFVFQPEGMTDNDYCFDLYLDVDDELKDDEALRKALYEATLLVDADGNTYSPKSSLMPSEGADLVFMYVIPNDVPEDSLQLVPAN